LYHADGRAGGRTDRQTEATGRFSEFCERAQKIGRPVSCQTREFEIILGNRGTRDLYPNIRIGNIIKKSVKLFVCGMTQGLGTLFEFFHRPNLFYLKKIRD
jgi:hypothetical protein